MKKQVSTYPLRFPKSLQSAVAEFSKADGTSINHFVTSVAEKVCAIRAATLSLNVHFKLTSQRSIAC